jgi:hypothetical protein
LHARKRSLQRRDSFHVQFGRNSRIKPSMPGDGAVCVRDSVPATDVYAECGSLCQRNPVYVQRNWKRGSTNVLRDWLMSGRHWLYGAAVHAGSVAV